MKDLIPHVHTFHVALLEHLLRSDKAGQRLGEVLFAQRRARAPGVHGGRVRPLAPGSCRPAEGKLNLGPATKEMGANDL